MGMAASVLPFPPLKKWGRRLELPALARLAVPPAELQGGDSGVTASSEGAPDTTESSGGSPGDGGLSQGSISAENAAPGESSTGSDGGENTQSQSGGALGAALGLSKSQIKEAEEVASGKYQGMTKSEYRRKQVWAMKSAIRNAMGLGPTGAYTPGGGGAFRGQELGYPPVSQNSFARMNPMQQALVRKLREEQQNETNT